VPVGETVKVGTVLAYVDSGDGEDITAIGIEQPSSEDLAETAASHAVHQKVAARSVLEPTSDRAGSKQSVSPRARRLAKELGVDLAAVRGSGLDGQVTEQDIRGASVPREKLTSPATGRRQLDRRAVDSERSDHPDFSVAAEVNAEKPYRSP